MDALFAIIWTAIPWVLLATGSALLPIGGRVEVDGITRPLRDPAKVLTWVRGFRLSMIGLALAGAGVGWLFDQTWLTVPFACHRWGGDAGIIDHALRPHPRPRLPSYHRPARLDPTRGA